MLCYFLNHIGNRVNRKKIFAAYVFFCTLLMFSACSVPEDVSSSKQTDDESEQDEVVSIDNETGQDQFYEYGKEQKDLVYRTYRMGTSCWSGQVIVLSAAEIEAAVEEPEEFAIVFNDQFLSSCKYEPVNGEIVITIDEAGCYCFFVCDAGGEWTDVTAYAAVRMTPKEGADLL